MPDPLPSANPVVDALNAAFAADHQAVRDLFSYRVPCNRALADHPTITVSSCDSSPEGFDVGLIGLINGVLGAVGLPRVAMKTSNFFWEVPGRLPDYLLVGFQEYKPQTPDLDDKLQRIARCQDFDSLGMEMGEEWVANFCSKAGISRDD